MENLGSCPICNSNKAYTKLTCVDDTVSKERFEIKECQSCGFNYTDPRPKPENLGRYYESVDYVSHSDTNKGLINFLYQLVKKHTLRKKVNLINTLSKRGSILDIGSGTGDFLNACKTDGWKTMGVEPSKIARDLSIKKHKLVIKEESEIGTIEEKSFEIISLWHVLEHVPDLNNRIKEIEKLLKKDGTLIIAVPNRTSYDAKVYIQNWAGYDVPRHLYHFSPSDIKKLFENYGFEIVKIKPMLFDAYYVSLLSEKIKTGKTNFIKGMLNGLISNLLAIKNKNTCSSQIYILRKTA